jgi:hypothetical protein
VTAAYSSAGARLHASLEHSPGELADMVNGKLTSLGALYDKGFHRSVREGWECVNLDVTDRERTSVEDAFRKEFGGSFSYRLNRLTVDSTGNVLGHLTMTNSSGDWEIEIRGRSYRIHGPRGYDPSSAFYAGLDSCLRSGQGSLREGIYLKYFGAPATPLAASQTADQFDGARARQAEAAPQAPVSDDARYNDAVAAVFAAAGVGQAGQAGRQLDATEPAWGPVDAQFDFWFPETFTHTMTGAGTL